MKKYCRFCALLSVLVTLSWSGTVRAQDSMLARTPPMGWNSWNHFACEVSDAVVRAQADAMVASGMKSVGYTVHPDRRLLARDPRLSRIHSPKCKVS